MPVKVSLLTVLFPIFQNAILDSLELFEEISHNEFLENTEFILFLNKHDLFVEKLKTSNLSTCFPDYEGKRLLCCCYKRGYLNMK